MAAAAKANKAAKASLLPPTTGPKKQRESLSAKKALGEAATTKKDMAAIVKAERAKNPSIEFTPIVEPTAPVAPVVVAPATLPVPELSGSAITPEPVAPVVAAPAKIKVGGKEYTEAELEAKLAEPAATSAPAVAPAPAVAAKPAPKQLTAEEVQAKEAAYVSALSAQIEAPMTEQEIDTILAGGPEAVAAMGAVRKRDMATAILHARKGIAEGFNPLLEKIYNDIAPLLQQQQQLAHYRIEQQFVAKYAEFQPHKQTCDQVAAELVKRYPAEIQKLTADQFIDEVARQTDLILTSEHKRWFPNGSGNWRQGQTVPVAPVVPPAAAATAVPAAAPGVIATAVAAPNPAGPRVVRAPAANAPAAAGAGGGVPQWGKSVAKSMRG